MATIKQLFVKGIMESYPPAKAVETNAMFDIVFVNSEGRDDETELTVDGKHFITECETLLDKLYSDFCKENGFNNNTVKEIIFKGQDPYYENAEDDKPCVEYVRTAEVIAHAEQCLVDNGIEADEAQVVLQALGYILLDEELYPDSSVANV